MQDILIRLWDWGHFRSPMFANSGESWNVTREDLATIKLDHPAVREAIHSYQDFNSESLEPIAMALTGKPAEHDGEINPATGILMRADRCACPDYYVAGMDEYVSEAVGSGSWPANCLPDWKNTHAITININKSGMGSHLSPVFESQVWPGVVAAYSEIGLMLVRKDGDTRANLQTSFVSNSAGWIGLAIVPSNQSCSLSIWNKFKASYRGSNVVSEWITLIKHELGHNMGMGHSRGGVMNPYIVEGLPISWKNDTSFPTLKRWFGGEPVTGRPDEPRMWTHYGFFDQNGVAGPKFKLNPPQPAPMVA